MSAVNHIAFIPDGNRRYAEREGIKNLEGHRRGYEKFKEVASWCKEKGIKELSFWGFSTENWKRSKEEVGYLIDLFINFLTNDIAEFVDNDVELRIVGRRSDLSQNLVKAIESAEAKTDKNAPRKINIFFNYGGQPELENALQVLKESGAEVSRENIREALWSAPISDPDLIIRTSGEQRLSGFLPWQSGYAELYFDEAFWPDFSESNLDTALEWFAGRERRFGGDSKK